MLPLSTPDADLHASPDRVAGDTVARTQTRYRAVAALGARDAKTLRDILDGEERLELVAVTHHARSLLTEVEQHGAARLAHQVEAGEPLLGLDGGFLLLLFVYLLLFTLLLFTWVV